MRNGLFLLAAFLIFGCTADLSTYNTLIDSVKQKYAPDKRVAIWEVEVQAGNPVVVKGKTNLPEAKTDFLGKLDSLQLEYIDSLEVLEAQYGLVSLSVCNIRSKPKHSAELSTQSTMGQVLRIYEKEGGWFRVQTPDNYLGWLDSGGFRRISESEASLWEKSDLHVYLPEYGFARSEPRENATPVSDLVKGNIFNLTKKGDSFSTVVLPDGKEAFVKTEDILPFNSWWESRKAQLTADSILAEAKVLLGRPYLWGGTSGKGMDCSGFTKEVFFRNGMILPRDASQQVHIGEEIETDTTSWSGLEAGDLLFFGRKATAEQRERIWHVAIYMGEGQIIHSSGEVKIESLIKGQPGYVPERVESFVRAKRLF
ncbi:MAG: C40 family peptidase [Bacteroidetes bacterium]|nr:C40 family peptidase [Bacteroidota bacterium]